MILSKFAFSTKSAIDESAGFLDFMAKNPGELAEDSDLAPQMDICQNMIAAHFWNHRTFNPNLFGIRGDIDSRFAFDYAVGDSISSSLALIEIEDARASSIFRSGGRRESHWGSRAEHGFSQIIDWIFSVKKVMSDVQHNRDFGFKVEKMHALLIIGRESFVRNPAEIDRIKWRCESVKVDGVSVNFATFDRFAQDINASLMAQPFIPQ